MLSRGQLSLNQKKSHIWEASSSNWQKLQVAPCELIATCIVAAQTERRHGETYPMKDFLDWSTSPSGILAICQGSKWCDGCIVKGTRN